MPANPLGKLVSGERRPSPRTKQVLRRYHIAGKVSDPAPLLENLHRSLDAEPTAEKAFAYAELAYLGGLEAEDDSNKPLALDLYSASVAHAYDYLHSQDFDTERSPYDPQFRRACNLYNAALEHLLRIVVAKGQLKPGFHHDIKTASQEYEVLVDVRGGWRADEIADFKFVSDYKTDGFDNQYRNFGLGVPLIAVRRPGAGSPELGESGAGNIEKFYPPNLSFPVTAFLRVDHVEKHRAGGKQRCVLVLYDSMDTDHVTIRGQRVPLESDLTTPLAYFLSKRELDSQTVATLGLLAPDASLPAKGLYMLEPYNPRKIPVLMVHGLWSEPETWIEMYNDLRSAPDIRHNYQFWFYYYPTGQPFWLSATQLRHDLAQARKTLDPHGSAVALDKMVLVGHSMGGLLSKMQTLESRDDYWKAVTDYEPKMLKASAESREGLMSILFFQPSPSIRRVVTIATPHRGSNFANGGTRWLGHQLIKMPERFQTNRQQLIEDNPGFFREPRLLTIKTSIDSLSPDSPILPVMHQSPRAPWVKYHNIVGVVDKDLVHRLAGRVAGKGDGVVSYASAHQEHVESEVIVEADHVNVHRHSLAILEVRRILLEHLRELRQEYAVQHAKWQAAQRQPSQRSMPRTNVSQRNQPAVPVNRAR